MNLVIVESPTKARTIGKFLGKDLLDKGNGKEFGWGNVFGLISRFFSLISLVCAEYFVLLTIYLKVL